MRLSPRELSLYLSLSRDGMRRTLRRNIERNGKTWVEATMRGAR